MTTPAQSSWIIRLANRVVGSGRRDNDWNYIQFARALLASAPEMPNPLAGRIDELIQVYGSLRELAAVIQVDVSYLSRLRSGEAKNPSDDVLRKLGLQQCVVYLPHRVMSAEPTVTVPPTPTESLKMGGCPDCGRRDCVARACANKLTLCPCHSPQGCAGYTAKDGVQCMKGSISL